MMKLILIGVPGAGKSTQGNLLAKQLNVPYLSTGHIFRNIAKEKTSLGRYVKETMSAGHLIPDGKTVPIVQEYLRRREYQSGYIIDGFPRTIEQAEAFKNGIDKVIYLELPDKEALWRIAYRNKDIREDQTIAAMKKRIDLFHAVTKPVINYYKKEGKLAIIDGTKSIKSVNKEILKNLGKQVVKNNIKEWQPKNKKILAVTGLAGSGKTEATNYFAEKGLIVIHFGNIVNEYINRNNLEHNRTTHQKIRMDLREKYGMEAFAFLNKESITKALDKANFIVIDGLRSFEEYQYLQREFKDVDIVILCLWASKELRYKRLSKRIYRGKLKGGKRDIEEVTEINKGPTIALADYMIINEGSFEDLHSKLDNVYRDVQFA
ncbi:hypothetical protein A3H80_01680 [Candidatus Roizmanbacteria bacterium RIFCSPLOWO2_02_FULL_37_19]|uniref:Adenylate kinase n=1 Tax=Candidatus Roizmanbacteria bacterium RIFCSPHIGHO2_02_FULL_37_24 TaxID=1802037 RepID=A0A1F7GWV4_9BACT|nr:MAG: hypothetical protein A3C24_00165 [Candidatus Roizmanbacteria bacterium RIFCSPHIGHO2_02_FULL_37_24]OGK43532.1 MAG: hypothetical protein A2956_02335 [Candidatus Roizmanbacteria bacterium RIFCSPLOWO2_01_FULL_37_57]OGK54021.1 MAG: hypothetical protein A3H80_01680 [Candidatus Roizmanbacteria bacterium RIFCSPLOWO2_02_FULL_37_19]